MQHMSVGGFSNQEEAIPEGGSRMNKASSVLVWVSCALVLASLFGCVRVKSGRKIDTSKLSEIEEGETTKQEVQQMFGSPESRISGSGQTEMWGYEYSYVRSNFPMGCLYNIVPFLPFLMTMPEPHQESQSLSIEFRGGKVVDYTFIE